jgi:NADH:ubiquinone oxidoreductase subunit 6 (subunit J)
MFLAIAVAEIAAVPLFIAKPPFLSFLSIVVLIGLLGVIYLFGFAPMEKVARAEPAPRWAATTYVLAAMLLVALCLIPAYAIFRL